MLNIIGNSCAASFIMADKDKLNQPICNPFSYNILNSEDAKYLVEHYNDIDFKKIILEPDEYHRSQVNKITFDINVDNKIRIFYPLYVYDKDTDFERVGHDIRSNKIEDYIVGKYKERLKRMMLLKPIFVFGCAADYGRNYFTNEQIINILNIENNFNVIIAQTNDIGDFQNTNKREYIRTPDMRGNAGFLAKYIWENSEILKNKIKLCS